MSPIKNVWDSLICSIHRRKVKNHEEKLICTVHERKIKNHEEKGENADALKNAVTEE